MNSNKSAAIFRAANVIVLDYCLPAALASALRICDEAVIVVDSSSEDNTLDLVHMLRHEHGSDRVILLERTWRWDRMWQEKVWNWAMAVTDTEWLMYADADEAISAKDAQELRDLMARPEVKLIAPRYRHYYGTPNWYVVNKRDFCPRYTRFGRRSHGYRVRNWRTSDNSGHAVCEVVYGSEEKNAGLYLEAEGIVRPEATTHHYGWTRNADAMGIKQRKIDAWYKDGDGLEDGHLPDAKPAGFAWAKMFAQDQLRCYEGDHPDVMTDWFASHKDEWAQREQDAQAARQGQPDREEGPFDDRLGLYRS